MTKQFVGFDRALDALLCGRRVRHKSWGAGVVAQHRYVSSFHTGRAILVWPDGHERPWCPLQREIFDANGWEVDND